jgi:hypothetical protein
MSDISKSQYEISHDEKTMRRLKHLEEQKQKRAFINEMENIKKMEKRDYLSMPFSKPNEPRLPDFPMQNKQFRSCLALVLEAIVAEVDKHGLDSVHPSLILAYGLSYNTLNNNGKNY